MWDERYQAEEFVYGTEPNAFLREAGSQLTPGRVLCLAEGEGRNAVFLAEQGHTVTAVDASAVGLKKAQRLAIERGVQIRTEVADLSVYKIEEEGWDTIVSIFCHLPKVIRTTLHKNISKGLTPGGLFILEAYTPAQLAFGTGGPPVKELMLTLTELRQDLADLDLEHALETERDVIEGSLHTGRGAVVQLIARKPGA
ncbi:SAM-dependent methyltransferase [Geopsychrobacter electrodiphilus]|uniref:SAM-dependent methyltransferase n=1 Tax=Geopsychrobacter electrodiphilus TaxID=225196 RepID=UPI0003639D6A|nr:class I SAM-dependent methyltransferase [Geopsychrobacter electrodiphilus]